MKKLFHYLYLRTSLGFVNFIQQTIQKWGDSQRGSQIEKKNEIIEFKNREQPEIILHPVHRTNADTES